MDKKQELISLLYENTEELIPRTLERERSIEFDNMNQCLMENNVNNETFLLV